MPSACMAMPLDIETVSSDPVQGGEGTVEFLIQRLGDIGTVALGEAIPDSPDEMALGQLRAPVSRSKINLLRWIK